MPAGVRVLIVADDPLTRAGLAALLAGQDGCTVAGQTASSEPAAGGRQELGPAPAVPLAISAYRPDVLLWDLGWTPQATLERMAEVDSSNLPIAALIPDSTYAQAAWEAGARGLLLRDASGERLVAALLALAQNLAVIDPSVAPVVRYFTSPAGDREWEGETPPLVEALTAREREVLQLIAEGLPNKAIAAGLNISEHTVKFHVNAILGKLGAQSRTEAVVRATRLGLILL